MDFSGKITRLLIGTLGFGLAASALLLKTEPKISQAAAIEIAQALAPEEINLRVKQTVVRIDGASVGSGSIVDHSNDVYTVLTNWHVMKNSGDYIVQTIDGRKHQVDSGSIQELPGLDLAILRFTSDQNYQTTETGDSANLNEGQSIYFAGYPGELRREDNRYYRFFTANLVGILPKSTENGYSLIYNGEAFPGMSGGPVLNQQGLMIGVHGEANVNAISGGTSNYAIPINTYKSAIAKLDNPVNPPADSPPTVTITPPTDSPPTITITPPATETPTQVDTPEQPEATASDSEEISSVPTFISPPSTASETEKPAQVAPETVEATTDEKPSITNGKNPQKSTLVSSKTGIDYRKLRDLLKDKKWSEADLHTYKLVEQIVKTAKQQNKNIFIELKTIAKFSCSDIRTIDNLWKEYSNSKFGFSPQQEIWQTVNQNGDFSTQTWRQFATKVGWKKGEVENGSGYLLYEQLNFDPTSAPSGHLPWWFALPEEEQKVVKQLFARCNFTPTPEELAAEAESARSPNSTENVSDSNDGDKPDIDKPPKSL